jgi:ribosomal protein S19
MIGKKVYVYNGIKYLLVKITSQKVGHKLGEFVSTRIKAIFKKNKKKKKKK